jgi:hypothetical protein
MAVSHPFDGPRTKVYRARQNVRRFERHTEANPSGLWRFSMVLDRGAGAFVLTVAEVRAVPLRTLLLIDEAAHHLRSALDQLLFAVALADSGVEQETTQFPLVTDPADWDKSPNGKRTQTKWLAGASTAHRDAIEKRQPYHPWTFRGRSMTHPLKTLSDLNNDNKHRILQEGFVILDSLRLNFPLFGENCEVVRWLMPPGGPSDPSMIGKPMKAGTELARIPVSITGPDPKLSVEVIAACHIGFRNGIGCANLRQAATYVAAIIREFSPVFDDPAKVALWQAVESRFRTAGGATMFVVRDANRPPASSALEWTEV